MMAFVKDLSGNNPVSAGHTDSELGSVSRNLAATPIGATTPNFSGEIVVDTTNEQAYRATGTTSADWTPNQ